MKIGLVCPYSCAFPGGVQTQTVGMANFAARQGHDVSVFAPDVAAIEGLDSDVERAEAGPTRSYSWNGSVARVGMGPTVSRNARAWRNNGDFDVVHLHEPMTPSASFVVWQQHSGPTVATVHAARKNESLHRLAGQLLRSRVRRFHTVTAVSEAAANLALAYLPGPISVIPNAIATPVRYRNPVSKKPRVLFLGRDDSRKGLHVFLDAADSWIDQGYVVDIAGNARPLETRPGLNVHGMVSLAKRARLMSRADVFVAPYLFGESFGVVLAEAVTFGCRVVASDLPEFRWLGNTGASVVYCPPGDAVALAKAVTDASALPPSDPACVEHLLWEQIGPRFLDMYAAAAGRSASYA